MADALANCIRRSTRELFLSDALNTGSTLTLVSRDYCLFHLQGLHPQLIPKMDYSLSLALDYSLRGFAVSLFGTLWIALVFWYLATYLISPLRRIPGPFLAGELWRPFAPMLGCFAASHWP